MPDAPTAAAPADHPEPQQARPVAGADTPHRSGGLLNLVRKLIDYGKNLAATLQQNVAATRVAGLHMQFGSTDIALILARITRGLLIAAGLEARLISVAARPEKAPAAASTPSHRQPRAAPPRPAAQPAARSSYQIDPRLAGLPTAEQLAAAIRRRPIGAVLADICRDLGILPSDWLWRELSVAINHNGGNLAGLVKEIIKRIRSRPRTTDRFARFVTPPMPPGWRPPPLVSFGEVCGTGPP